MAALTTEQLKAARAKWMREHPADEPAPLGKADLLAAFAALDAWLDSNAASANNALPAAAKSGLTTRQKARLMMYVIQARYGVA